MNKNKWGAIIYISLFALLISCNSTEDVKQTKLEHTEIGERTLIGYTNKHTVRAGDKIEFKVSSLNGNGAYAQLVRVVNGDSLSKYRDHFKMIPTKSSFEGEVDCLSSATFGTRLA